MAASFRAIAVVVFSLLVVGGILAAFLANREDELTAEDKKITFVVNVPYVSTTMTRSQLLANQVDFETSMLFALRNQHVVNTNERTRVWISKAIEVNDINDIDPRKLKDADQDTPTSESAMMTSTHVGTQATPGLVFVMSFSTVARNTTFLYEYQASFQQLTLQTMSSSAFLQDLTNSGGAGLVSSSTPSQSLSFITYFSGTLVTPSSTPSNTVTSTVSATNTGTTSSTGTVTSSSTMTPSRTSTSSHTSTSSQTSSSSNSATSTQTSTASMTSSPTNTPTSSGTPTPSVTSTSSMTATSSQTATSSVTATPTNTATPSVTGTASQTSSPSTSATSSSTASPSSAAAPVAAPDNCIDRRRFAGSCDGLATEESCHENYSYGSNICMWNDVEDECTEVFISCIDYLSDPTARSCAGNTNTECFGLSEDECVHSREGTSLCLWVVASCFPLGPCYED